MTKFSSQPHPLNDVSASKMESIKYEGEAEFPSVTNMICKQEGEALDLDEQAGSNPSSNSLMMIKVTQ